MTGDYKELYTRVLNSCLAFITFKDRTIAEVNQKISKLLKSTLADGAETLKERLTKEILEYLTDHSFLDDYRYAETYILQKSDSNAPYSKLELAQFLYKKGVAKQTVSNALEAVYTTDLERSIVQSIVLKKLNKKDFRAQKAYLFRRGFSADSINSLKS